MTDRLKIGDQYGVAYDYGPVIRTGDDVHRHLQYKIGQKINILDNDHKKLAKFVVEWSNHERCGGRILVTYGHKRGRKK